MSPFLQIARDGAVVTVTLNRPDDRNAITETSQSEEFAAFCADATRDLSIRAIILTGAGKAFCSGGNVKNMRDREGMFAGTPYEQRNAYRTSDDGWVCLSASTQGMTEKLLRSIGREELITDPRFANNPARLKNIDELDGIVAEFVASRTLAENLEHFDRTGVTIGPIMDTQRLEQDRYVAEREALIEVPDDEMPGGMLPMVGHVPRLSATPTILARPAPKLGEHNEAILGAETCARLRASGAMPG